MAVRITSQEEKALFEKIKNEIKNTPVKKITSEEKKKSWCKKLSKLTGIDIRMAEEIAEAKLKAKKEQIEKLQAKQKINFSVRREKLINTIERSNPLRRISDIDHARAIIAAYERHSGTTYDFALDDARELAAIGDIDYDQVRSTARKNARPLVE